jgi:hypothetical protein
MEEVLTVILPMKTENLIYLMIVLEYINLLVREKGEQLPKEKVSYFFSREM